MAFCRWSNDCDVYCYEDSSGGFTTHVSGRKDDGKIQNFNDPDLRSFLARLRSLREAGYRFPDDVIAEVESEIERFGPDATETDL
jgi:hypothetical protein